MDKMPILVFRLEGPLQSWGEHSKWDNRDTSDFPSKSAIVGLLSCALGWERGDDRIVSLSDSINIAVRADRKGTYGQDFQTVFSDELMSAKRKRRENGGTIISLRNYIEDGSFLVCISGERTVLEMCKNALDSPKWPVYLGRKSCVPACPVIGCVTEEYSDLDDAVNSIPLTERHDVKITYQKEYEGGTAVRRLDNICNSESRIFSPRLVEICSMKGGVD